MDVLVIYSLLEQQSIGLVASLLRSNGLTPVLLWETLRPMEKIEGQLRDLVAEIPYVVFFLSRAAAQDKTMSQLMEHYHQTVREGTAVLIPVLESEELKRMPQIERMFGKKYCLYASAGLRTPEDCRNVSDAVKRIVEANEAYNSWFRELKTYRETNDRAGISRAASEMLILFREHIDALLCRSEKYVSPLRQMLLLAELLESCSEPDYSENSKTQAGYRSRAAESLFRIGFSSKYMDLPYLAIVLRIIYYGAQIRLNCMDTLTEGNLRVASALFTGPDPYEEQTYVEMQRPYLESFRALRAQKEAAGLPPGCTAEETEEILQTDKFIFGEKARLYLIPKQPDGRTDPKKQDTQKPEESVAQAESLRRIAEYLYGGVKMFEELQGDPAVSTFLKCLMQTYKRLRDYCNVVEYRVLFEQCVEQIRKLEHTVGSPYMGTENEDKLISGMKALLGYVFLKGRHFDAFISYRHKNYTEAEALYKKLEEELFHVFMDVFGREEYGFSEYKKVIESALESSGNFILLITDMKDLEAFWIDFEITRYLEFKEKDPARHIGFYVLAPESVKKELIENQEKPRIKRFMQYEIYTLPDEIPSLVRSIRQIPSEDSPSDNAQR